MSVFILYAVVPAGRLPPPAGATGGQLSLLSEGSLAVVYEEREQRPATTRTELVAFGKAVEAIGRAGPALPVRYGTVLEELDEARELLRAREQEWRERLSFVADHVEILVHAYDDTAPAPAPASAGSGREYLLSRAAARRHTDTMHDELVAAVSPHCRDVRRLRGRDEVRLACLVRPEATDKVRSALTTWADAQNGRRATTTGPWPPFSFAEEEQG